MPHLWEMETLWFSKNTHEHMESTFPYKSWKDFTEYKPYKLWKPYILSSWSWKTLHATEETQKVTDSNKIILMSHCCYIKNGLREETKTTGDMLQIVFLSPDRFTGVHRVEIIIQKTDEENIKEWLRKHMPGFWKLDE